MKSSAQLALVLASGFAVAAAHGQTVTEIPFTSAQTPSFQGIASDGTHLYLTAYLAPNNAPRVLKVPIEGGLLADLYGYGLSPNGVEIIGNDVVWGDANSGNSTGTEVLRAPKAGGGLITKPYACCPPTEYIADVSDVTTDGTLIFTVDQVQGQVYRMNLDGSGLVQVGADRYSGYFDREHANFIDEEDGVLYIADRGRTGFPDTPPRVDCISKNSVKGAPFTNLYTGVLPEFSPNGLAVINGTIYLTNGDEILQMPTGGGTPTFFATDPSIKAALGIVRVGTDLYVSGTRIDDKPGLWRITTDDSCYADCDGNGVLNIDDFICFQTRFALGC